MIKFLLRHLCRLIGSLLTLVGILFTFAAIHATRSIGDIPVSVVALTWIAVISLFGLGRLMIRHAPVAPKIKFGHR